MSKACYSSVLACLLHFCQGIVVPEAEVETNDLAGGSYHSFALEKEKMKSLHLETMLLLQLLTDALYLHTSLLYRNKHCALSHFT